MKRSILPAILFLHAVAFVAQPGEPDVPMLVRQLGSANFSVREKAASALRDRPEAEPVLRKALATSDSETKRRIEEILDHLDRKPVRELQGLAKDGFVNEVIKRVATWPVGKHDNEVWSVMRQLTCTLHKLHTEKNGEKFSWWPREFGMDSSPPRVWRHPRTTLASKADLNAFYFVRTDELDLATSADTQEPNNWFSRDSFPVVSGRVRYLTHTPRVTYAGADVDITAHVSQAIVVCAGNVRIRSSEVASSLIIARGAIVHEGPPGATFIGNHVIAGKTVTHSSKQVNIIRENDQNPLGLIRWPDSVQKAAPTQKNGSLRGSPKG